MSDAAKASIADEIGDEIIFGALRRERLWRKIGMVGAAFGVLGCLSAAMVAVLDVDPPPLVVPMDPTTGLALPNASVRPVGLSENQALIDAMIYQYVIDRETYNQLDNDARVRTVLARSTDQAATSLRNVWNSASDQYPPNVYGNDAEVSVDILSITDIGNDRAQIRLTKRLTNLNGVSEGQFTVILQYDFAPEEERRLEAVWQNPLGFRVSGYRITSDRFGQ